MQICSLHETILLITNITPFEFFIIPFETLLYIELESVISRELVTWAPTHSN